MKEVAELIIESLSITIETEASSPGSSQCKPARARRDYAREARLLLQQRFRERLRVEDVARALYVSSFHLCRIFKEETGVSMHRYLNHLRLQHALGELARGEAELSELALELGFSCQSHFTKAFRKEFGIPPGKVRRLAQSGT